MVVHVVGRYPNLFLRSSKGIEYSYRFLLKETNEGRLIREVINVGISYIDEA